MKTWQDAVNLWTHEKSHKRSFAADLSYLKWLTPAIGATRPLNEIDTAFCSHLMQRRAAEPGRRGKLADASVVHFAVLLHSIMKLAHEFGYVETVPDVRRPTVKNDRDFWLTKSQGTLLVNSLPQYLAHPAQFTLHTGLRAGNVSSLRWDHIDLSRKILTIPAQEMKTGKPHSIPLNTEALKVLFHVKRDIGLVFTRNGKQIKQFSNRDFRETCARIGLAGLHWHDLRHTHFSWLVQAGVPLDVVKRLGGWSSYDLVLRYAHHSPETMAEAVNRI